MNLKVSHMCLYVSARQRQRFCRVGDLRFYYRLGILAMAFNRSTNMEKKRRRNEKKKNKQITFRVE